MSEPIDPWFVAKLAWGALVTFISTFGMIFVRNQLGRINALEASRITRDELDRRFAALEKRLDDMEMRQTAARAELKEEISTQRKETRDDFKRLFDKFDEVTSEIRSSTVRWHIDQR